MTEADLERLRIENGYLAVRRLPDGSVATLSDLLFTRSICLDADEYTPFRTRRFCFEARSWADREFALLQSKWDIPDGFIASHGLPLPDRDDEV